MIFRYLQPPSDKKQRKFLAKRRLVEGHARAMRIADEEILSLCDEADFTKNPARTILSCTLPNPFYYWLFESPQDALDTVINSRNRNFFYQIEPNRPVRCYMDIERPCSLEEQEQEQEDGSDTGARLQFVATCRRLIAYFCCFVDAAYLIKSSLYYDGQWYLYSASTSQKMSLHAHCNLVFRNVDELNIVQNNFIRLLRHMRRHDPSLSEFFHEGKCILDGAVLTARPFRLAFNAKRGGDLNHLMPVDDDEAHLALNNREHLAQCFIHPMPTLHGAAIVDIQQQMPAWPATRRSTLLHKLIDEPTWPCRTMDELNKTLWDACTALFDECAPAPMLQCVEGACVDAVARVFLVHPSASTLLMPTTQAIKAVRHHWLMSIAAILEMLYCAHRRSSMDFESELAPMLSSLLQRTYDVYISLDDWPDRLAHVASLVTISQPPARSTSGVKHPANLFVELAFCLFYVQACAYDADPRLNDFLTAAECPWPAALTGQNLRRHMHFSKLFHARYLEHVSDG